MNLLCSLNQIILILILLLIIVNTILLIFNNSLLGSIALLSTFSVGISILYLLMDAPDVAMTEIALGCALSTLMLLSFAKKISSSNLNYHSLGSYSRIFLSLTAAFILVISLSIIGINLPKFGDASSPIQINVNKYYIENTHNQIKIPSMVAAILASYRGYDTLGETLVILIAGIGVLLILRSQKNAD